MIKALLALIAALPEILKLIKNIQDQIDRSLENKKVKDELKKLNEAFENEDADSLRELFNSK